MATPRSDARAINFQPQFRVLPRQAHKVAIFGFGTVGRSVAKILSERAPSELRLTHIFNRGVERKRVPWVSSDVRWTDAVDEVLASDADIVVEVAGGIEPANSWVRRALLRGKSVVTANKQLIAAHGPELAELARRHECRLEFGAAVAGGVPVLCALQPGLCGDHLHKVHGILNGTCNYILHAMESRGADFAVVLAEAQQRGYAEADPSDDLNGIDARAKLAIVARIAFQVQVAPEQLAAASIVDVSPLDFRYAGDLGCTVRQVARAELKAGVLYAAVQPALVSLTSPLGRNRDNQNVVVATGKYGGETVFSGAGAGGGPTAVAVVSDLLSIARSPETSSSPAAHSLHLPVSSDFRSPHYVRLMLNDNAGALPAIRRALGERTISLRGLLHKPEYDGARPHVVVVVEECAASALHKALQTLTEFFAKPPVVLPIV